MQDQTEHNKIVAALIQEMNRVKDAELWIGAGRDDSEQSFVYLNQEGMQGIGFLPNDINYQSPSELEPYLERLQKSATTDGILREGLKKVPLKCFKLPSEIQSNALLF